MAGADISLATGALFPSTITTPAPTGACTVGGASTTCITGGRGVCVGGVTIAVLIRATRSAGINELIKGIPAASPNTVVTAAAALLQSNQAPRAGGPLGDDAGGTVDGFVGAGAGGMPNRVMSSR